MGIDLFWDFLFWYIYLFIYFGVNATLLLLLSNKSLKLGCLVFLKVIFVIICPLQFQMRFFFFLDEIQNQLANFYQAPGLQKKNLAGILIIIPVNTYIKLEILGGSSVKNLPIWQENTYQCRRPGFAPWVRKIPWIWKWQPTPVFLPEKSHGQRSLVGYSPWGHKNRT